MKKLLVSFVFIIGFLVFFGSDRANAQTCPAVPTNTGRVTLSATTTAGTYRVWSRMKAADSTNNSFYVQIDSNCPVLVGNSSSIPASWTWVDYRDGNSANKIDVTLSAGTHVVTVIGNEPGVGVDKILMTKNLACVPTGTSGDNCPAEIPATPTGSATDTTAPVISNPRATDVTGTTARIRWELNEYASGQVEYGTSASYGKSSAFQSCCQYNYHIQSLSGLTSGVTYHYRIKSIDKSGNQRFSGDCTFTTGTSTTTFLCTNTATSPTPTKAPTPTPTKAPTPTPTPPATVLRFSSVKLHGIGSGGDNTNPALLGNQNPLVTSRAVTVEVLTGSSTSPLSSSQGNITYKPATGDFGGDIAINSTVPTGNYIIKIKSPQYLKKQLSGILTINKGVVNSMPGISLITGDINNNNSVSQADLDILNGCYSDLLPAKDCDTARKAASDLTSDGKVNADDYNLFLREQSVIPGQ